MVQGVATAQVLLAAQHRLVRIAVLPVGVGQVLTQPQPLAAQQAQVLAATAATAPALLQEALAAAVLVVTPGMAVKAGLLAQPVRQDRAAAAAAAMVEIQLRKVRVLVAVSALQALAQMAQVVVALVQAVAVALVALLAALIQTAGQATVRLVAYTVAVAPVLMAVMGLLVVTAAMVAVGSFGGLADHTQAMHPMFRR